MHLPSCFHAPPHAVSFITSSPRPCQSQPPATTLPPEASPKLAQRAAWFFVFFFCELIAFGAAHPTVIHTRFPEMGLRSHASPTQRRGPVNTEQGGPFEDLGRQRPRPARQDPAKPHRAPPLGWPQRGLEPGGGHGHSALQELTAGVRWLGWGHAAHRELLFSGANAIGEVVSNSGVISVDLRERQGRE